MDRTCNCDEAGVELDVETGEYHCSACISPCYENEEQSSTMKLNIYEVGIMSNKVTIKAPSACAAAMYYGIQLVNTNNPFMTVVYTENGEPWQGDSFWLSLFPDEAHVHMVLAAMPKEHLELCEIVDDPEATVM